MADVHTKTQFGIEPPAAGHQAIQARSSVQNLTKGELRDGQNTDDEYDMEDLTESIMQGLRGVYAYRPGEIDMPTFDEFVEQLYEDSVNNP